MGTGGAFGWGPVLGSALLLGALATGCGESDPAADARATVSPSASPSATPPEELCTKIVAHWSRKALVGDTYGDYQSMGLSNGQYDILRKVVDAARVENERAGPDAAERLIDARAREGCEEWYREGGPGDRPWR
ncbi:hypothetical protein PV416_40225 [Streptomyces ipomoeae]|jgi:hypothetical protein|uniref:hypothetical protein n=1 Tax=Streptomyces ipomoeae TaxID=103232 RepID=UPI0029BC31BC|nr:hypothetical protein [Streptomyces ipomoeae]MDX2827126.1 hypothetical protein [Streptomyces ipomoeae]MDX2875996.1 hypothetical protein [Streptomyces ipomoeae]